MIKAGCLPKKPQKPWPYQIVNAVDDAAFPTDVIFTPRAVGGAGVDLSFAESIIDGCQCSSETACSQTNEQLQRRPVQRSPDGNHGVSAGAGDQATPGQESVVCVVTCACSAKYGPVCNAAGQLLHAADENRPLVECGRNCACPVTCTNRFVQRNSSGAFPVEIFRLKSMGWGVRSLAPVPAHSFVCEYAGHVVPGDEARARDKARQPGDGNFLMVLHEHRNDGVSFLTYVDASRHGNASRFFNHSCEPNLTMRAVRAGSLIPRLAFFAAQDIHAGEELTFSYGEGSPTPPAAATAAAATTASGTSDEACSTAPDPVRCLCGSKTCRGFLPYDASALL